jgi:hypothetical protein
MPVPRARATAPSRRAPSRSGVVALGVVALLASLVLGAVSAYAQSQPNFKPLDRGDITEQEQKLLVIRGIEVDGDYALRVRRNQDKDMPFLSNSTEMDQDFRLHLNTTFNEDVAMVLTLQTSSTALDAQNLRTAPATDRGTEANGETLTLVAREAYLRWRFNPNSQINFGQFDLELGDRRGKVYRGIASGVGCYCRLGTWDMPFGATKVGPGDADWVYHWALRYNAYNDVVDTGPRSFSVEIFRILYTENNIPLGANLGPGTFNPAQPGVPLHGQLTDDSTASASTGLGNPLFYDATGFNYFGLRTDWQGGPFSASFDLTAAQGSRTYHLYRDPATGITIGPTLASGSTGPLTTSQGIDGTAIETELAWKFAPERSGKLGFRYMTATGDSNRDTVVNGRYKSPDGIAYNRGLNGYYEITPGTYRGTRLYFNGVDTDVDLGGGLGHSVNNKVLYGFTFDIDDRDNSHLGYSGGLYGIELNNAILNAAGRPVKTVGTEWDNMMSWYIHKKLYFQFELNLLSSLGAMSVDDNTPPPTDPQLFVQVISRIVYKF